MTNNYTQNAFAKLTGHVSQSTQNVLRAMLQHKDAGNFSPLDLVYVGIGGILGAATILGGILGRGTNGDGKSSCNNDSLLVALLLVHTCCDVREMKSDQFQAENGVAIGAQTNFNLENVNRAFDLFSRITGRNAEDSLIPEFAETARAEFAQLQEGAGKSVADLLNAIAANHRPI